MIVFKDIIANIQNSGSTQLLAKLFGNGIYKIFGSASGDQAPTMLVQYGALISSSLPYFYLAIVGYILIVGLMNAAQSGEFLLKKWDGNWPIIRLIIGLTALVPSVVIKSLYAIQVFVISLALISSSIADLTWRHLLGNVSQSSISHSAELAPNVDLQKTNAYLDAAFNYSACMINKLKYHSLNSEGNVSHFDPTNPELNAVTLEAAKICGGQKFVDFLATSRKQTLPEMPAMVPENNSDLISSESYAKFNAYQSAQFNYIENQTILAFIKNEITPFYVRNIDKFTADNQSPSLVKEKEAIWNKFHTVLNAKIKSGLQYDKQMAANVFTTQVSRYGWISAANYYHQLAQQQQIINTQISTALMNSPSYVDLNQQADITSSDDITQFQVDRASRWIKHAANKNPTSNQGTFLGALGGSFLKMGNDVDPILAMTKFGQVLEGSAEAIFVTQQAASYFSWIPIVGHIKDVVSNSAVNVFLGIISFCGLILGTVLPLLPPIFFIFAILSWLVLVCEMYIAAPLWVVANALPSGENLISDVAKKGLNNFVYILLFPTLAIGGLVASISLSWVGMSLVNAFAYVNFNAQISLTIPFEIVGIILVYTALSWIVLVQSLGLIESLPQTVLNWLSFSAPGLNQFSGGSNKVINAVGGGGSPVSGLVGGLGQISRQFKRPQQRAPKAPDENDK